MMHGSGTDPAQRPNPAFKRTHTGGAGLWGSRLLRVPVWAA